MVKRLSIKLGVCSGLHTLRSTLYTTRSPRR
jgi:hypothetical protein